LPTCSTIEYEMTDTSHYDDWTYMKMTNLVKNKWVLFWRIISLYWTSCVKGQHLITYTNLFIQTNSVYMYFIIYLNKILTSWGVWLSLVGINFKISYNVFTFIITSIHII